MNDFVTNKYFVDSSQYFNDTKNQYNFFLDHLKFFSMIKYSLPNTSLIVRNIIEYT